MVCGQCMITSRRLARMEVAAIALVILGIVLATVADSSVLTNLLGVILSCAAILFSAVYQVRPWWLTGRAALHCTSGRETCVCACLC